LLELSGKALKKSLIREMYVMDKMERDLVSRTRVL
jgi:hypothetical protein